MSDETSKKEMKASKVSKPVAGGTYYGRQIQRGGGEFISNDKVGFEAAVQSLAQLPSQTQAAQVPDEWNTAFAQLRKLAELMPVVKATVDLLQMELGQGATSRDEVCADYVRMIARTLPETAAAFQTLIQAPPVNQMVGPLTRAVVEQLAP